MLENGSSDNVLKPCIINCLKLPIQSSDRFQVIVGNGNTLATERYIDDLLVHVKGYSLCLPVYLLAITRVDLVLGASWLKTLGPHIVDYDSFSIKFYVQDKFITLKAGNIIMGQA